MMRILTLLFLAFFIPSVFADILVSSYLFKEIPNEILAAKNQTIVDLFNNEKYPEAATLASEVIAEVEEDLTIDKLSYARFLSNAAIIQATADNLTEAALSLDQAITLLEEHDPFHPDLFNILVVDGFVQDALKQYDAAEDALRRAQHIAHRHDGVYTPRQIPLLVSIANVMVARGDDFDADREQRFNLKVNEHNFGANSETLIPTLTKLGTYFANRASSLPIRASTDVEDIRTSRDNLFRESVALFERAIHIIEDKYGSNDLRLIDPLKGLARTKYLQGYGRANAKKIMERALDIVTSNPATDKPDHAKALIDLADFYNITSDKRATETYKAAWDLLASDPNYEDLQYQYFGKPMRLHPETPVRPTLTRHPVDVEKGNELYVDLQYDVMPSGKVDNVRIVDGNVPNSEKRVMRNFVGDMRFRPRIVDGELVPTEGLSLHQVYTVKERIPETKISISAGPGPG